MYTLNKETFVETTMQQAWDFICSPANLNLITPDDMAFEIVTDLPEKMTEGMLVQYNVRIPFMGKQPWLSELKYIVPGRSFVDEQKIGPYKLWYHYHEIRPLNNGVLFIDRVTYEVPYGPLGKFVHALFIRRTLERIFRFREQRFNELLGPETRTPATSCKKSAPRLKGSVRQRELPHVRRRHGAEGKVNCKGVVP